MMREIWDHPFGYALLKIERANQHILDIEKRLRTSSDHYGPSLHMDGQTGQKFLYYTLHDRYLRSDLALIAGDAVHNLRSALDITWREVVRRHGAPESKYRKFPIDPDQPQQWLEGVLTTNAGIDSTSPVFDFMLNHVKSYKGGNVDILTLHSLDIDDKHRLLIPVVAVTGIMGVELKNEDGSVDVLDITIIRPDSFRRNVGLETQLQHHGELIFHIEFRKGTPAEGSEMTAKLLVFHGMVKKIVRAFQRFAV